VQHYARNYLHVIQVNQSINQPLNQLADKSVNQPIEKSINQLINQSVTSVLPMRIANGPVMTSDYI